MWADIVVLRVEIFEWGRMRGWREDDGLGVGGGWCV